MLLVFLQRRAKHPLPFDLNWIIRNIYLKKKQPIELSDTQGPVVRRPISVNPRLNLTWVSFSFVQKHFPG